MFNIHVFHSILQYTYKYDLFKNPFVYMQVFCFFSVHVVFGEVVSGQEIITHIEGLPVDRMSRPLQDAKVVNCGELVLKIKNKGIIIYLLL